MRSMQRPGERRRERGASISISLFRCRRIASTVLARRRLRHTWRLLAGPAEVAVAVVVVAVVVVNRETTEVELIRLGGGAMADSTTTSTSSTTMAPASAAARVVVAVHEAVVATVAMVAVARGRCLPRQDRGQTAGSRSRTRASRAQVRCTSSKRWSHARSATTTLTSCRRQGQEGHGVALDSI